MFSSFSDHALRRHIHTFTNPPTTPAHPPTAPGCTTQNNNWFSGDLRLARDPARRHPAMAVAVDDGREHRRIVVATIVDTDPGPLDDIDRDHHPLARTRAETREEGLARDETLTRVVTVLVTDTETIHEIVAVRAFVTRHRRTTQIVTAAALHPLPQVESRSVTSMKRVSPASRTRFEGLAIPSSN